MYLLEGTCACTNQLADMYNVHVHVRHSCCTCTSNSLKFVLLHRAHTCPLQISCSAPTGQHFPCKPHAVLSGHTCIIMCCIYTHLYINVSYVRYIYMYIVHVYCAIHKAASFSDSIPKCEFFSGSQHFGVDSWNVAIY